MRFNDWSMYDVRSHTVVPINAHSIRETTTPNDGIGIGIATTAVTTMYALLRPTHEHDNVYYEQMKTKTLRIEWAATHPLEM